MNKNVDYFLRVVKHKKFVFQAGRKVGVPLHRLILHDWTKFLPVEFFPYANFDFSGETDVQKIFDFNKAWLHHQNRNDHHWQYWIIVYDDEEDKIVCMDMPEVCIKEMVADWMGASKVSTGSWDMTKWLYKNLSKIIVSDTTKERLYNILRQNGYSIRISDLGQQMIRYVGEH